MSPYPQSVTNSSTFPTVFLSPPGIIEAAFVNFGAPKYLQWPRWIRGSSVLDQVSVTLSNIQKCSFVVHNHCRRYTCKKRSRNR